MESVTTPPHGSVMRLYICGLMPLLLQFVAINIYIGRLLKLANMNHIKIHANFIIDTISSLYKESCGN